MAAKKKPNLNVESLHPDFVKFRSKWRVIRDVLGGEEVIKDACRYYDRRYLPLPKTEADELQNAERYEAYLARAVFYNATGRTLSGLVGQVFSKPPVATFPEPVSYLETDPAGSGVTIEQQAKSVLGGLLSLGRAGLWVDYPTVENGVTKLEADTGIIRPVILSYDGDKILNWRTRKVGARTILSLVVIEEEYLDESDAFVANKLKQFRELRLDENGEYFVQVWKQGISQGRIYPKDANGNPFYEIPFVFVGILNNDSEVDEPPMYDMATINIAHFRNSADYEESCFMVGQPTPWFSGLTDDWVRNTLKGKVFLGSRGGVPLPSGGAAGLLQVSENGIVKEAMDQKESQMVALGAKLVQGSTVVKTATEVTTDKVSEVSTLSSAARNTSAAYIKAFEFCSLFSNQTDSIEFVLSTDFEMSKMTSQELLALFTVWQGKGLATSEYREIMRKAGYATLTLEEAVSQGAAAKIEDPKVEEKPKVDNNAK